MSHGENFQDQGEENNLAKPTRRSQRGSTMEIVKFQIPRNSKIFLLEDSQQRIDWFKKRLPNLVLAERTDKAIEILSTTHEPFDFVFLDHDLGILDASGFIDDAIGNGEIVAKHLASQGFLGHNVCIHSWNPEGALRMKNVLNNAIVIPFGRFEIQVI